MGYVVPKCPFKSPKAMKDRKSWTDRNGEEHLYFNYYCNEDHQARYNHENYELDYCFCSACQTQSMIELYDTLRPTKNQEED